MCRLLAWIGAERTLSDVVLTAEHSLLVQSYAPRRQRHGTVNADGWGVAWWPTPGEEPARWRSTRPLWQDATQSFGSVARHVSAGCILASVRDATPGMPIDETATAPFVRGPWALAHNGTVDRDLCPRGSLRPESACDSAVLASYLLDQPQELGRRVSEVGTADPRARLNVILSDGNALLGTAWGDTLFWRQDDRGTTLASEPDDDRDGWHEVPDRHLILITRETMSVRPLEKS